MCQTMQRILVTFTISNIHGIKIEWGSDNAASDKLEQGWSTYMYDVRMPLFSLQTRPTHDLITLSILIVLPDWSSGMALRQLVH